MAQVSGNKMEHEWVSPRRVVEQQQQQQTSFWSTGVTILTTLALVALGVLWWWQTVHSFMQVKDELWVPFPPQALALSPTGHQLQVTGDHPDQVQQWKWDVSQDVYHPVTPITTWVTGESPPDEITVTYEPKTHTFEAYRQHVLVSTLKSNQLFEDTIGVDRFRVFRLNPRELRLFVLRTMPTSSVLVLDWFLDR